MYGFICVEPSVKAVLNQLSSHIPIDVAFESLYAGVIYAGIAPSIARSELPCQTAQQRASQMVMLPSRANR